MSADLKADFAMPDPIAVIENCGAMGLVLIDGGDKKYYLWHDDSDVVAELFEPNLAKILFTFDEIWGFRNPK